MDVIHARCAGLDVHKQTVVACVRRREWLGTRCGATIKLFVAAPRSPS